jgi:hypothetical protein
MAYESEIITEEVERESDEIIEWWEGFGLDAGRLVCKQETQPVNVRENNAKYKSPYLDFDKSTNTQQQTEVCAIRKRPQSNAREENEISLPPSPMENINLEDLRRKGSQYVPMGHNLRHDLSDYLSWNSRFVSELTETGWI